MTANTNWPLLFLLATTLACVSADATSPLGEKTVGGVQSRDGGKVRSYQPGRLERQSAQSHSCSGTHRP